MLSGEIATNVYEYETNANEYLLRRQLDWVVNEISIFISFATSKHIQIDVFPLFGRSQKFKS